MTREQEIEKAALDTTYWYKEPKDAFREGARWADEHPHWHPISQEPEKDGVYLVLTVGKFIGMALFRNGWYKSKELKVLPNCIGTDIAYWIELPNIPQEPTKKVKFPNTAL
jgi:hypothetical protein